MTETVKGLTWNETIHNLMRPKATNLYRLHILSITIILQNKYGIIHGHDSLSILAYGI